MEVYMTVKRPTLVAADGCVRPPVDKTPEEFYHELEIDVLARTMWGEARGQGNEGLKAVACVVLNRVAIAQKRGRYWWGNTIIQVCQKPYQFSCWNRSDPNFKKLQAVDKRNLYFATCLRIARRAVLDLLEDNTGGATHYHANYVDPYWAKDEVPTITIGDHIFYKLV
jgi:N-acetylmuramoyl-L-alanine amidase